MTVQIPGLTISQPQNSDEDGNFKFTFQNVKTGIYEMAISAMKDGASNELSQTIGIPEGLLSVTISDINLPLTSVEPVKASMVDLNEDGRVNLYDLSILLYHWGTSPSNPKIDINNDGIVNLQDFSLMLSHWTN